MAGELDYFIHIQPLLSRVECGDTGMFKEYDGKLFLALLDVLGHGDEAYEVAKMALEYLNEEYEGDLIDIMNGLHKHLRGTRGLVGNIALIDIESGELSYVGIGNVDAKVFGGQNYSFPNRDGVVGYKMPSPRIHKSELKRGDVLFMCTDGISRNFDLTSMPQLRTDKAENLTEEIVRKFGKTNDDKASLIVKYK